MSALLFFMVLGSLALAWFGRRHWSMTLVLAAIALGVVWFGHHVTSAIHIDL
ncbi:MAG: DUF5993 family protein [Desulfarculaceae bacterium]|nr:DUF5993 family protein [Desulfarculaceae bacterium]MCF8074238.1 DUF5993 family protein [Desulfarculaceae bacterium]MCF8103003.1 DUF5993 family protein [Desulfarculaceae bacterium]MCF8117134.1 DUF5993 family protein [Desulfarculaceae bacterium]